MNDCLDFCSLRGGAAQGSRKIIMLSLVSMLIRTNWASASPHPKKKYLNTCAMHKTRLRPPPDNENLPFTAQTLSKCRWVDDITIINIQPISCCQKVYCCKAASQPFTTFPCDTLISNLVVRCLENSPEIPPQPSGRNLGFCPNLIYIDARVGSISTYSSAF